MKNTELNGTLLNADQTGNNESNSELIKRKDVENTPFTIITIDGESFGVMGEFRVTEKYDKVEKAEEEVKKITWNRVVQVILILNEKFKDIENMVK